MLNINQYYNSNTISFKSAWKNKESELQSCHFVFGKNFLNTDNKENTGYNTQDKFAVMKKLQNLMSKRHNLFSNTDINVLQWVRQFETEEEQLLALKMLEKFKYVDMDNARKAFKKVFEDIKSEGLDINNTMFATLGKSKSGSMMGYLFRQANKMRSKGPIQHEFTDKKHIASEKFLDYTQLKDIKLNRNLAVNQNKENLVIIDDIIGDGDSLIEYFTDDIVESLKNYKNIYYVTLIGDPDGIERVQKTFPELNILFRPAKKIYKYNSEYNTDFTGEEKKQIDNLIQKYNKMIDPDLMQKYSRSHLLVSFAWNSPGNTPMMFNVTNNNWAGLFMRYNGIQEGEVGKNFNFVC